MPDFFAHEGAIIAAIARPSVPRLYTQEPGRLLMADLPGDNFDTRATALAPMVDRLTQLQADWIDRVDDLLRLGLPDRRLHLLPAQIEQLVTDRLPHFPHPDQRTLTGLVDDLDRRCRAVTDCGIPETLTHGDFHPCNVHGTSPHYVIIDWGDSCLSHPLSDPLAFTRPLPPADQTRASTWFADASKRTVPGCEPERAADLLRPMLPLIAAVTYNGFCQHIEDTELTYHAARPARDDHAKVIGMSVPIAELLPLAVGIAASITTILTMVLMLLSPHANSRTVGLLVGCLVGVAGTVALFALLAGQLSTQQPDASPTVAAGMKTLVGVVLVVLALRQWRRRKGSEPTDLPKWMTGVDSMTTGKALVLGLLLSAAVPKNLLLGLSAGIIVGEARLSIGGAAVVIAVFTAVAISTVAVPIAAHLLAPDRVRGPLQRLREWLVASNRTIMVVVLLAIGLYMIGNGITSY